MIERADYEHYIYSLPDRYPSLVHHKHIHPDIKHHRIPAEELSFDHPNLDFIIEEIEREVLSK